MFYNSGTIKNNIMKNIFFAFLVTLSLIVSGQKCSVSLVIDLVGSSEDTVLYGSVVDISGATWSATVVADVDTSFVISFGGSNNEINTLTHTYAFQEFDGISSTMPFTFLPDSQMVITNADTTYEQSFTGYEKPYVFAVPAVKISNPLNANGTVEVKFKFAR